MPKDPYLDEFPAAEEQTKGSKRTPSGDKTARAGRIAQLWERLSHAGLGETVYRVGTAFLTVALILLAVIGMRSFYMNFQHSVEDEPQKAVQAAEASTPTPTAVPAVMPVFAMGSSVYEHGIVRQVVFHTTIPTRARTEVITYTVKKDDTILVSPRCLV